MPELPEVECVIRALKKNLIGQSIKSIKCTYKEMIKEDYDTFCATLIGKEFRDITRKGKYIIFHLSSDTYLVSHLRMEGKYFLTLKNSISNPHILVEFETDDYTLYYQDVRKFGVMYTKTSENLFTTEPLSKVANDPIEGVDVEGIFNKLKKLKKPIKEALLDQSIMSGLGNIYVDEVLFKASISPLRKSCDISLNEVENIVSYSKEIFLLSIELGGTTIRSFTSSFHHIGHYQDKLLVHTKEYCPICKKKLEVIRIGGRSSYYCTNCQK